MPFVQLFSDPLAATGLHIHPISMKHPVAVGEKHRNFDMFDVSQLSTNTWSSSL